MTPLFLYLLLHSNYNLRRNIFLIKLVIALTFVCHGLYAIDSNGNVGLEVLECFKTNQKRTLDILNTLEGKDLRSFKVTTALGKILKLYVGEAMAFAIAHNQRHVLQAQRVLDSVGESAGAER